MEDRSKKNDISMNRALLWNERNESWVEVNLKYIMYMQEKSQGNIVRMFKCCKEKKSGK
jgi:hypothetical protein